MWHAAASIACATTRLPTYLTICTCSTRTWLQVMFSKPLPDFSCRLNALATAVTCQWLMGPCTVNDVELDDGRVRERNTVQC